MKSDLSAAAADPAAAADAAAALLDTNAVCSVRA